MTPTIPDPDPLPNLPNTPDDADYPVVSGGQPSPPHSGKATKVVLSNPFASTTSSGFYPNPSTEEGGSTLLIPGVPSGRSLGDVEKGVNALHPTDIPAGMCTRTKFDTSRSF